MERHTVLVANVDPITAEAHSVGTLASFREANAEDPAVLDALDALEAVLAAGARVAEDFVGHDKLIAYGPRADITDLDHNVFCEVYAWTRRDGTYLSPHRARARVHQVARRSPLLSAVSARRRIALVDAVLNDRAWARRHRGETIASVAREAIFEAIERRDQGVARKLAGGVQ